MSKEFRPIFAVSGPVKQIPSFKDDLQKLAEERRRLEKELSRAHSELESLRMEKTQLERELEKLRQTLSLREEELRKVSETLKSVESSRKLAEELAEKITSQLRGVRESLKNDFVHIAMEVLREFLMTDVVPKEEVITKILEEVFTKAVDLRGSVKVHLNPQDVDRAYEFIGSLSDRLSGRVEVEIVADSSLSEGEVRVETPRFIIERKHDEILEEIFREVLKRVLEGG